MEQTISKRKKFFNALYIVTAYILTLACLVFGNYTSETSSLQVGSVSPRKFVANEEIKNDIATQRNIDKALSELSSLYTKDFTVEKRVIENINSFFDYIIKNREALNAQYKNNVYTASENDSTDNNSISGNNDNSEESVSELPSGIYLSQNQIFSLIGMSSQDLLKFKENITDIANSALEQGIRDDNEDKAILYIKNEFASLNLSPILSDIGTVIIEAVLEPNLIIDVAATEKAREEKISSIKPVMVLKNQKIVDTGEIITEEIYSILYNGGYIKKDTLSENIIPLIGTMLLILFIFILTLYYIYRFHKKLYIRKNETALLFSLYSILTVSIRLLTDMNIPYMFMPVLTFTMLCSILLNYRLAIVLNFCICIVYYIVFNFSTSFLIYFATTGMFGAFTANALKNNNKIFKIGLLNCVFEILIMLGITLYINKTFDKELLINLFYAFLNGIITLILFTGSMPLWEFSFGIVTQYKLLELINPDNILLKKLMLECPGTYHHSIIVANLAEAAAFEIGVNSSLAKVGGYYHDIGKLKYPQYFSENIKGENPHNSISPYKSAEIIANHVTDGIKYAEEYKLPEPIIDIIAQHHGNTLINFFYYKAKQDKGSDNVKEADFRYKHKCPISKEAAIVMLADTIEAAVRSKNMTDIKEMTDFVHTLIQGKLTDGQFNYCSLKISDLKKIENAFMKVLCGMYHERVAYPSEKEEKYENKDEK